MYSLKAIAITTLAVLTVMSPLVTFLAGDIIVDIIKRRKKKGKKQHEKEEEENWLYTDWK